MVLKTNKQLLFFFVPKLITVGPTFIPDYRVYPTIILIFFLDLSQFYGPISGVTLLFELGRYPNDLRINIKMQISGLKLRRIADSRPCPEQKQIHAIIQVNRKK